MSKMNISPPFLVSSNETTDTPDGCGLCRSMHLVKFSNVSLLQAVHPARTSTVARSPKRSSSSRRTSTRTTWTRVSSRPTSAPPAPGRHQQEPVGAQFGGFDQGAWRLRPISPKAYKLSPTRLGPGGEKTSRNSLHPLTGG